MRRWAKISRRDNKKFKSDLMNFLRSEFAENRMVLVDSRVSEVGFHIPEHENVVPCSTDECIQLLKTQNSKYICLTIGTSYWFPSIGDSEWIHYPRSQFRYPVFAGCRPVLLAEIHCACEGLKIDQYYRLSVYRIDGIKKTVTRLGRFEKGKQIDEANLRPGEDLHRDVLRIDNFNGPGEYRDALEAEGWGFGTICCWGVSQAMQKHHLSFPEACRYLGFTGALIRVPGSETDPDLG